MQDETVTGVLQENKKLFEQDIPEDSSSELDEADDAKCLPPVKDDIRPRGHGKMPLHI